MQTSKKNITYSDIKEALPHRPRSKPLKGSERISLTSQGKQSA